MFFYQIREIHIRSYLLKDLALEIFTTTGDAFLIIFSSTEVREHNFCFILCFTLGEIVAVERVARLTSVKFDCRLSSAACVCITSLDEADADQF